MTGQLTFPTARNSDPETSREAGERSQRNGPRFRHECLAALVEHGPLTDFELAEVVGRLQTSAGKRRFELVQLGLVERTEWRRNSPSGSPAIVWAVTDAGRDEHARIVEATR